MVVILTPIVLRVVGIPGCIIRPAVISEGGYTARGVGSIHGTSDFTWRMGFPGINGIMVVTNHGDLGKL